MPLVRKQLGSAHAASTQLNACTSKPTGGMPGRRGVESLEGPEELLLRHGRWGLEEHRGEHRHDDRQDECPAWLVGAGGAGVGGFGAGRWCVG